MDLRPEPNSCDHQWQYIRESVASLQGEDFPKEVEFCYQCGMLRLGEAPFNHLRKMYDTEHRERYG